MLVLSRKRDERILIGDNIVVTIVDIRGDKVRIGIEAPANVAVHREEILLALQRQAAEAANQPNSSPTKPNNS
ncbi:carbon storage regulator CsrA [Anatilimnocola sp. NA78]|uniref:carbon storage regulator CsrA n=1 Tax=Anatilimnocola sp. NA78 TaxID=3415683 RepID=UPI003CE57107